MARRHANNGRIYRAVVTRRHLDGSSVATVTYGPYDTPGAAKAQITYAANQAAESRRPRRDPAYAHTAEGHVESADVVWMREALPPEGGTTAR